MVAGKRGQQTHDVGFWWVSSSKFRAKQYSALDDVIVFCWFPTGLSILREDSLNARIITESSCITLLQCLCCIFFPLLFTLIFFSWNVILQQMMCNVVALCPPNLNSYCSSSRIIRGDLNCLTLLSPFFVPLSNPLFLGQPILVPAAIFHYNK